MIFLPQVELAQPRGDAGIARPWSKHSEGSSRSQKLSDERKRKEAKAKGKNDVAGSDGKARKSAKGKEGSERGGAEKEEFMAALKKRSEARFWDNDDAFADQPPSEAVAADEDEDKTSGASSDEDDESSHDGGGNSRGPGNDETKTVSEADRNKKSETMMSNMDWLRSKVGTGSEGGVAQETASTGSDSDEGEEMEGAEPSKGAVGNTRSPGRQSREKQGSALVSPPSAAAAAAAAAAGAADTLDEGNDEVESGLSVGRLFVRNLPYTSTEDDLRELFEAFGALSEVHLPVDDVKKVRHLGSCWSVHL